ncbi:hypothetical protein BH10CYA1_BH10CYA1_40590 [soil metagenome]
MTKPKLTQEQPQAPTTAKPTGKTTQPKTASAKTSQSKTKNSGLAAATKAIRRLKETTEKATLRNTTPAKNATTETTPMPIQPPQDIRLVKSATPWGTAQSAEDIAPGITKYSTASHGGYFLNKEANAKIPPELQWSTLNLQGLKGWYEEDCDWAIVAYTYKEYFQPAQYEHALEALAQHHTQSLGNPVRQKPTHPITTQPTNT